MADIYVMSVLQLLNIKIKLQSNDKLNAELTIPSYQRPYKWGEKNIIALLNDIEDAIENSKKYGKDFKYRIGTIILHNDKDNENLNIVDGQQNENLNIVDGQQRIISLMLLMMCLNMTFENSEINIPENPITQSNICKNHAIIKQWVGLKNYNNTSIETIENAIKDILEVVVVVVDDISEAFQLFDSQNSRGKSLDPHDLLKAYHLREMKSNEYEMKRTTVAQWEAKSTTEIRDLFDLYLYPIWNWSRCSKKEPFTKNEIDIYKGISESSDYTYAKRTSKAAPYFQITQPFIAGKDFFDMVEHYLTLLEDIKTEIDSNEKFKKLKDSNYSSEGYGYARNLFYCALLCYYDKFHNFDEMAVKKIFVWAFMIRVDMQSLGFATINKYAIGESDNYTNKIAMFEKINLARLHSEIGNIVVNTKETATNNKYKKLLENLKNILGITKK